MAAVLETYAELTFMESGSLRCHQLKSRSNLPRLLDQDPRGRIQTRNPVIQDKSKLKGRHVGDAMVDIDIDELPELCRQVQTEADNGTLPVNREAKQVLSQPASFENVASKAKTKGKTYCTSDKFNIKSWNKFFSCISPRKKKSGERSDSSIWLRPFQFILNAISQNETSSSSSSSEDRYVVDECPGRYNANITDPNLLECRSLEKQYYRMSRAPGRSKILGRGETSKVILVEESKRIDVLYAVKVFKKIKNESEESYITRTRQEFCLSVPLRHANIVQTVNLCTDSSGRMCHVMSYAEGGDLMSLIKQDFMNDKEKDCCFKQLMRGVCWLHGHGIAHRDIRPENLLMAGNGHLKIADFGTGYTFKDKHIEGNEMSCGCIGDEDELMRLCSPGNIGKSPYLSPEVVKSEGQYDPTALDIWSCATVYIVMYLGVSPWQEATQSDKDYCGFSASWNTWLKKNPVGIVSECRSSDPGAELFETLPYQGVRTLYRMMHPQPEKRITAKQVFSSIWMTAEIKFCFEDGESDEKTGRTEAHTHTAPKKKR